MITDQSQGQFSTEQVLLLILQLIILFFSFSLILNAGLLPVVKYFNIVILGSSYMACPI